MFILTVITVCVMAFFAGFYFGNIKRPQPKGKRIKIQNEVTANAEEYHNFLSYNGEIQ